MMRVVLTLVCGFVVLNFGYSPLQKQIPFQYPLFKQCNSSWGSDIMVTKTICQVGCLMSSISMALKGHNIQIGGKDSDPGVLNDWLRKNGGYDNDNDLSEEVIYKRNPQRIQYDGPYYNNTSFNYDTLEKMLLSKDTIVIANVMHGGHFVLMTGFNTPPDDVWYVNDPGFNRQTYTYEDIVGYRVFTFH